MKDFDYQLETPGEIAETLAERLRRLRLDRNWTQETLAERSGVSLGSLRRFERTGEISLKHLLCLSVALGRLGDFNGLFEETAAQSMRELEARHKSRTRRRGSK